MTEEATNRPCVAESTEEETTEEGATGEVTTGEATTGEGTPGEETTEEEMTEEGTTEEMAEEDLEGALEICEGDTEQDQEDGLASPMAAWVEVEVLTGGDLRICEVHRHQTCGGHRFNSLHLRLICELWAHLLD